MWALGRLDYVGNIETQTDAVSPGQVLIFSLQDSAKLRFLFTLTIRGKPCASGLESKVPRHVSGDSADHLASHRMAPRSESRKQILAIRAFYLGILYCAIKKL